MEAENKVDVLKNESSREPSSTEPVSISDNNDRKDEDEEEEEEEEEDKIVEKSHNSRFHKRNKRFPKKMEGVDNAFFATEPKSGKEFIWNECILSDRKTDKENRYLNIIKKLKRNSHPFLARFLDAWIAKRDDGSRKLVFITERLDECTLKQFLCNSAKNNRMWERHVGQLLSVLMFLHRLGITHGNLTKESICFQNNGNLRVGPFALGGCLDHKAQSSDVYSLGVVALEIAVWTPSEFPQNLDPAEELELMMSRLDNNNQKSFIEACLDPNLATRYRVKRLINHPAVTDVPILKLLSAMVIVESVRFCSNEEGAPTEQTGFATLMKDYLSHYEDETVIMEVRFPHDNVINSRSWKDFRSNFTLTPKYLDDVKNGFYPLFGCRWNWATYQEDEEESVSIGATMSATGAGGSTCQPGVPALGSALPTSFSTTSSGGGGGGVSMVRVESSSVVSQVQSSAPSSGPSASVSRKHSSSAKATDQPLPMELQTMVEENDEEVFKGKVADAVMLGNSPANSHDHQPTHHEMNTTAQSPHRLSSYPGGDPLSAPDDIAMDVPFGLPQPNSEAVGHDQRSIHQQQQQPMQPVLQFALPRTSSDSVPFPVDAILEPVGLPFAPPPPTPTSAAAPGSVPLPRGAVTTHNDFVGFSYSTTASTADSYLEAADTAVVEGGQAYSTPPTTDAPTGTGRPSPDPLISKEDSMEAATGILSPTEEVTDKRGEPGEREVEGEDEEEEEEEEEEDEEDEEEDEEEDNKVASEVTERCEPQTIHVVAPERAPSHTALFTHCQYFYIGAGRWQVYVQMWFIEDRLKRETYVQVFDYEWHDCERVADLFEASRCLNPMDRPSLIRLLALARHNCPLVDGELQFPGPVSCTSHLDTFELHEKLTALRLHQQAREMLQREAATREVASSITTVANDTRQGSIFASTELSRTTSHHYEKASSEPPLIHTIQDDNQQVRVTKESTNVACAEHLAQLQTHEQPVVDKCLITNTETATIVGTVEEPEDATSLFFDVGSLAPRNAYCALCDTHEYLHRVDLPAYLISPCYHCREALAKEAKISPETLLDLHLQNHIPWPGFLQARFNLPLDGRPMDELISYDCRWRSRNPCQCLLSTDGPLLPPCVEFPWLYPLPSVTNTVVNSPPSSKTAVGSSSVVAGSSPVTPAPSAGETSAETRQASVTGVNSRSSEGRPLSPEHSASWTAQPCSEQPSNANSVAARTITSGSLPCSDRHSRGAPITCCHNIQFPLLGVTTTHQQHPVSATTDTPAQIHKQAPPSTSTTNEVSSNIPTPINQTSPGGAPILEQMQVINGGSPTNDG